MAFKNTNKAKLTTYQDLKSSPDVRRAYRHLVICLLAAISFGVPIAWFAPNDVLTRIPFLREYTNVIVWFVPSIGEWERYSDFPQVTRLYLSFMWSWVPLCLYLMLRLAALPAHSNNFSEYLRMHPTQSVLVLGIGCPIFVVSALFIGDDNPRLAFNMHHSRVGLSIIGILTPFTVAMMSALFISWVKYLSINYLRSK